MKLFNTRLTRRTAPGFTLAEVLVALGVSTIVLSAVGTAFHNSVVAMSRSEKSSRELRIPNSVLALMESDLAGVFTTKDGKNDFVLKTDADGQVELVFSTSANGKLMLEKQYVTRVCYAFTTDSDERSTLVRSESSGGDGSETATLANMQTNIRILCYDGKLWVSGWDVSGKTPEAVKISFAGLDGVRLLSSVVLLPR